MNKLKKIYVLMGILFMYFSVVPLHAEANLESFLYLNGLPPTTIIRNPDMQSATVTISPLVQNGSDTQFNTPICAIDRITGQFLGCVPEVPFYSGSAFSFNVTGQFMRGHHIIQFSYLGPDKIWHTLLNNDNSKLQVGFTIK